MFTRRDYMRDRGKGQGVRFYGIFNERQRGRGKWTLRLSRFHAMVASDDCSGGRSRSFQLSRAEWRLNWHCLYDRLRCPLGDCSSLSIGYI